MDIPDKFTINSSAPLSYINYYVVGRGNILESGRVNLEPEKPKVYNLTLTPKFTWMPHFTIYISYVNDSGHYHYEEQSYNIDSGLENQVTLNIWYR